MLCIGRWIRDGREVIADAPAQELTNSCLVGACFITEDGAQTGDVVAEGKVIFSHPKRVGEAARDTLDRKGERLATAVDGYLRPSVIAHD